jgi:hypothetical protein
MEREGAQERLDAYRPKAVPVPGTAKPVSTDAALKALKASGLSIEDIMAALGQGG